MAELTKEEQAMKDNILKGLAISGKKDIVKAYFRTKLVHTGWKEEVQSLCREEINNYGGLENISVDQIYDSIAQPSRESVPNDIKAEMIDAVMKFAIHWPTEQHKYGISDVEDQENLC